MRRGGISSREARRKEARMKIDRFLAVTMFGLGMFGMVFGGLSRNAVAQETAASGGVPANGISAHLVVTVEPHHGSEVPVINQNEVMVYERRDRDPVTEWIPAQGDHAALELFVLLDDAASESIGVRLDDIRQFINAQPASTKIGAAYMQNGTGHIEQNLTSDHAQAAKALRLPLGSPGINASPYISLSDLVKKWPATTARREVLMIGDGIDRYYEGQDLQDPYLAQAIDDADRAAIVISAIYNPGAGHFAHSYWQTYWGQIYLSELADKTGGEAYYIGFNGAPVSFTPYLNELGKRLTHQYLLTFLTKPPKKAGWLQVRLGSEVPNVDLISAGRVYVTPEK
jgi:hypothetical protein